MKKCPHLGQSVRAEGSTCPLFRQDMRDSSSRPEPDHSQRPAPCSLPNLEGARKDLLEHRPAGSFIQTRDNLLPPGPSREPPLIGTGLLEVLDSGR